MDENYDLDNEDDFLSQAFETPGVVDYKIRRSFEKDLEDARDLAQRRFASDPDRNKARMDFVKQRQEGWKRVTEKEHRNFLHVLAYYDYTRKPTLQWLMARAILRLPELMGAMDSTKRTPLTVAISVGNEMFVYAACKNVKEDTRKQIGEALDVECRDHDNDREITCLHTAISSNFNAELTKIMIGFVSEKMFVVTDLKGRTPLHLAVDYSRCSPSQVGVVSELLRRGPDALDIRMPDLWGRFHSVYQHHENTRRALQNKRPQPNAAREGATEQEIKEDPTVDRDLVAREIFEAKRGTGALTTLHGHGEPLGTDRRDKGDKDDYGGHSVKRQNSMAPPRESSVPMRIETRVDRLRGINSPASLQAGESAEAAILREKERKDSADEIREQLKLIYLRKKKPHEAAQFLHIQDEKEKELWFDFGPQPKTKITPNEFRKHFGHLQFDKILQYVAYPHVELDHGDDAQPDGRYQGRQDMLFFFDWLRKKGVQRIIKVIVYDLNRPSHNDEAIEQALEPFSVEILDWRRLDLCPVTISRVGKDGSLREIYLQWSGSNAVLRSWSEPEGLALTPSLESIYITQVEGLCSSRRTKENLDEFERRLHKWWPEANKKPAFFRPRSSNGGRLRIPGQPSEAQTRQKREPNIDPHRWMQCMEEFASFFRQIKGLNDEQSDPALNPVMVALIDDGADITHPELNGKKFPGKSFHYYKDGSSWRVSPYWDSASGHGTLMARLIHRICPSAVIYVIKLQTYMPEGSNKLQINPASAIQAIDHAVEQGAQIISMSWTTRPPQKPADRAAFDEAIHKAKGIPMFCSASDQGKFQDFTYPHASNPNCSFRIGAAKATGSMADFVGDAHELNFILPGHEVVVDRAYEDVVDREFQGFASHTGSSVATALAAGLAALVLECVRLGVFYTEEAKQWEPGVAIRKDDLVAIKERPAMEYALSSIGVNRQTDNKYIEVWDTFSDVAMRLKEQEGARLNQLEIIAALARVFLRKGVKGS